MKVATALLESYGFAAVGVFSEAEAQRATAEAEKVFAVVAGGSIDEPAQDRLRVAAQEGAGRTVSEAVAHDHRTGPRRHEHGG